MSAATLAVKRDDVEREAQEAVDALRRSEADAASELRKLAGAETLGEVSAAHATKRRTEIERDLAERREHVEKLRAALPEIERRIAVEVERERRRAVEARRKQLAKALGNRDAACRAFARALRDANRAAGEVGVHRAAVAEARAALLELDPEAGWPEGADEAWDPDDVPTLVELIGSGPERPLATEVERLAEAERTRQRQLAEIARWAVAQGDTRNADQLPEPLRTKVRDEIERRRKEQRERREAAERARRRERVGLA